MNVFKNFIAASVLVIGISVPCIANAGEPGSKDGQDLVVAQGEVFASAAELSVADRERFMKVYVPYLRDLQQRSTRRCEIEKRLFAAFKSKPTAMQEVGKLFEELNTLDRNDVDRRASLFMQLNKELAGDRAVLLVMNDRTKAKRAVVCQ